MSVLLTACKKSKQRAIENALRKKQERKRQKYEARAQPTNGLTRNSSGPHLPYDPPPKDDFTNWTFSLDNTVYNLQFCRDTLDVLCNDEEIDTMESIAADEVTVDFVLGQCHKCRISLMFTQDGETLTIDGTCIPQ